MTAVDNPAGVLVITGIMAAGKSTVAEALALRFARGVHPRGDVFRRAVVSGRAEMTPEPSQEALTQLALRHELACAVARRYAEAGFFVVYQDVILGRYLSDVVALLGDNLRGVVVLCPNPDVVAERENRRSKTGYIGFTPSDLDRTLRDETPDIGLWRDNSALSVDETVDAILARLDETRRGIAD